MYTNQNMNFVWNNTMSDCFTAQNEVKQGGFYLLFYLLFIYLVDELLCKLHVGYGCTVGHIYCGAFDYADDISLASPTIYCLKQMYAICRGYAKEFDVRFNPAKFQLVSFNSNASTSLVLEDTHIHSITTGIHLGHEISWQEFSVRRICNDLHWRVSSIISNYSYCDHTAKLSVFNSYCIACYSASLWNLESTDINQFYVTWRKSIRKILGVS